MKSDTRMKFKNMSKYAVYYGAGELDQLSQFHMVVVEPLHRTTNDIEFLHKKGALVLAYVSVMEVHSSHPIRSLISEDFFITDSGNPETYLKQPEYGNYLIDLSNRKWHGILLNHIGQLLITQGYDGIFLDTIGDVEMPNLVNPMVQVDGAVRLVQNLRKWFPNAVLVQNNGLELLCMQTAPDLDGIAWENPPLQVQGSQGWVNAIAKRLSMLQQEYGIVPMVLFEDRNQMSRQDWLVRRDFSDQHGFCAYYAPKHYMSLRTIQE